MQQWLVLLNLPQLVTPFENGEIDGRCLLRYTAHAPPPPPFSSLTERPPLSLSRRISLSDVEDLGVEHRDASLAMLAIEALRTPHVPSSFSHSARARSSGIGRLKTEPKFSSIDASATSPRAAPFLSPRETSRMRRSVDPPFNATGAQPNSRSLFQHRGG